MARMDHQSAFGAVVHKLGGRRWAAFVKEREDARSAAAAYAAMQEKYSAAGGRVFYLNPGDEVRAKAKADALLSAALMAEQYRAATGRRDDVRVPDNGGGNTASFVQASSTKILRQAWRVAADAVGGATRQSLGLARDKGVVLARGAMKAMGKGAARAIIGIADAAAGAVSPVRASLATAAFVYFAYLGINPSEDVPKFNEYAGGGDVRTEAVQRPEAPPDKVQTAPDAVAPPVSPTITDGSNNPGNIRRTTSPWDGKDYTNRGDFESFVTPQYGLTAMAKNLLSHYRRGYDTTEKLVKVWAPPHENNTAKYISDVAQETGFGSNVPLDLNRPEILQKLMTAMMRQEIPAAERAKYTPEMFDRAVAAALDIRPQDPPVMVAAAPVPNHQTVIARVRPSSSFLSLARELCKAIAGKKAVPTSSFGPRWGRKHEGQDCKAERGEPIRAIFSGTVREAYKGDGYNGGFGRMVKVCSDSICGIYAHGKNIAPVVGSHVKFGQKLGQVGDSGHATGPHVHFQLQLNGKPIDALTRQAVAAMHLTRKPFMR